MNVLNIAGTGVPGAAAAVALLAAVAPFTTAVAEPVSFKGDVFPIIHARCLECHRPGGDGYEKSGLDLTSYEGLMKGTKFGSIVVPGDAFTSNLNVLVEGRADASIRMPHKAKKLRTREIRTLKTWVNQGAMNN